MPRLPVKHYKDQTTTVLLVDPLCLWGGALTTDEQGGCDEGCSARACELVHCHVGYGDDQGAKHSTELHRGGGQGGVRQCEA